MNQVQSNDDFCYGNGIINIIVLGWLLLIYLSQNQLRLFLHLCRLFVQKITQEFMNKYL